MTTRYKRTGNVSNKLHNPNGPKYQNSFAFKHNKHSKTTQKILSMPNYGLCRRCVDIIEWRKKFRKYKVIKNPGKCKFCQQRNVMFAYHEICSDCSKAKNICAKCMEDSPVSTEAPENDHGIDPMVLKGIRERDRRTLIRMVEKGEATSKEVMDAARGFVRSDDEGEDEDMEE